MFYYNQKTSFRTNLGHLSKQGPNVNGLYFVK